MLFSHIYFNMSNALCRLSIESIMYVLLDVTPTPETVIEKESNIYIYMYTRRVNFEG